MNKGILCRSTRVVLAAAAAILGVACTPSSNSGTSVGAGEIGISDSEYSLEALIAAAKNEDGITVADATGKILEMADRFTAKYGIQATGVKLAASAQEEILIRESQAQNTKTDVFNMSNLPTVTAQIIPEGLGVSWMPPDLKTQVPTEYQDPAITSVNPWMWVYNSEVYDSCPINNVWALTDAEWTGRVSIPDPMLRNETMYWFNQMEAHGDDAMAAAYEDYFGQPLPEDAGSATAEWVRRLAANDPQLAESDSDVGPVVGAPGQAKPSMGFVSAAIFGDAKESGFLLRACDGLKPWIGQLTPRVAVIATGTDSPNAAKLFVHYMMTEEGMLPQLEDGKISTNQTATAPPDEPSGAFALLDQFFTNDSSTTADDYARLQDWQDLWTTNLV